MRNPAHIPPIADHVARVHDALRRFLSHTPDAALRVGGARFPARLVAPAAGLCGFDFDYYQDRVCIGADLLRGWAQLRHLIGPARFEEVVRLFLLHEGHHIDQGMGYTSFDIGRAGVALEAVDYDADVIAIDLCLRFRAQRDPGQVARRGQMGTLADILDNVLAGMRAFDDPQGPRCGLIKERRLRRHLIWHLQRARARAADPRLPAERLSLAERIYAEFPGLAQARRRRGRRPVTMVQLATPPPGEPELVLYLGRRLYRVGAPGFCRDLLAALLDNAAAERVSRVLYRLFEQHPALVPG